MRKTPIHLPIAGFDAKPSAVQRLDPLRVRLDASAGIEEAAKPVAVAAAPAADAQVDRYEPFARAVGLPGVARLPGRVDGPGRPQPAEAAVGRVRAVDRLGHDERRPADLEVRTMPAVLKPRSSNARRIRTPVARTRRRSVPTMSAGVVPARTVLNARMKRQPSLTTYAVA